MKLFAAIFFLVSFTCLSQERNALILFTQDQDTFPDCITEYAVNGLYPVQPVPLTDLKIPGTHLVRPIDNSDHQILFTFANQASLSALGSFEIPAPYYVPRTKEEMDSILRSEDPNYESYYLSSPSYLIKHGFVKAPLEITETQREEERAKKILEEQKNTKKDTQQKNANDIYFRHSYPQVMDGVYIQESGWMQEYPFYAAHPEIKDSLEQADAEIRKNLKPVIDSILQPFYFSVSEVTNKEYRDFVEYVRDSIAVFLAYENVDDELASTLLNVSKKERKSLNISDREYNMQKYGWKKPKDNFYGNREIMPYIQEMYYPQMQRYYYRKEFDTRKFRYKLNDSDFVSVYPDTLGFKAIETDSNQLLTNMYFWHPAFDDYPVVNVSYKQMLAFCHWKELQINKARPSDSLWIHVSPPSIRQYEFALKHSLPEGLKHKAHDNSNTHFVTFERSKPALTHFLTSVKGDNKLHKRDKNKELSQYEEEYIRWQTANKNDFFSFLNGNVSEMVLDQITQEELNYFNGTSEKTLLKLHYVLGSNYQTDVKVLGDDQYNAIFYKTLQEKTKSNCTTGFRLVYMLEKR